MIKPAICICENKYADQLCSNKIDGFLMQRLILFQDLQCSLQIDTHTIIICKIFITQANTNTYEPRHKKTGFLPMRKQRRRSASQ